MKRVAVIILSLALLLSGCGRSIAGESHHEYQEKAAREEYHQPKAEDYKPYVDALVKLLSQAFDMVNVTTQFEGQDVIFIVNVAKDGMAAATLDLKLSADTENPAYTEWLTKIKATSDNLLKDLQAEIENAHIELRVLDDVDVRNYANGNGYNVRSLLELYDGEITYELMKDKSPESSEYSVTVTLGMENALKKALSYLSFSSFSYTGLIHQLEYEKFTHDEAVYAVNNCGVDWNEQAVLKAQSYLEFTSFSKEGLIEQLEYEGFTHDQAVYAVNEVGY